MEAGFASDTELIEIAITPKSPEDDEFCMSQTEIIVEIITSYSSQSGRKRQATGEELPSAYQYVLGAVSVPSSTDDNEPDNAPATAVLSIGLFATVLVITAAFFL